MSDQVKVHDSFNFEDADIILSSSDNVLFKLHLDQLANQLAAFPAAEHIVAPADGEIAYILPETAEILAILFQLIYPGPPNDLSELNYDALVQLSDACNKYMINRAVDILFPYFQPFIPTFSLPIFVRAVAHDEEKLMDASARWRLFNLPYEQSLKELPHQLQRNWEFYYADYRELLFDHPTLCIQDELQDICRMDSELIDPEVRSRIIACSMAIVAWLQDLQKLQTHQAIKDRLDTNACSADHAARITSANCGNTCLVQNTRELVSRFVQRVERSISFVIAFHIEEQYQPL